jgi:hypothetical protein
MKVMVQYSIMTYVLHESTPTPDHDNTGVALDIFGGVTLEEYVAGVRAKDAEEIKPLLDEYNILWDSMADNLQLPIQDDGSTFGGFTGHRIVTFDDQMGRCALGFQIVRNGADRNRSIVAYRRKVYADNRRRLNYLNDEEIIRVREIESNPYNPQLRHRLGVLSVWLDKYLSAEPYSG